MQVLRCESSFGAKTESKTVGDSQRVPSKSGQPFGERAFIRRAGELSEAKRMMATFRGSFSYSL